MTPGPRLHQPDRRSCGAAALVMARRLADPHYADLVTDQPSFAHEVTTLHRRLCSLADATGGWQVPWLRAVGTAPWAVARDLRLVTGTRYATHVVRLGGAWDLLAHATPAHPMAVYVGDRLLPRHVVLVTGVATKIDDAHATTYEPSSGLLVDVPREHWEQGRVRLAGWTKPWLVVAPAAQPMSWA